MGAVQRQDNNLDLRQFVPLDQLAEHALAAVAAKAHILDFEEGIRLFERGEATPRTFYLLQGKVELTSPIYPPEVIQAGAQIARYPLAQHMPRQMTCQAKSSVCVLCIEMDVFDLSQSAQTKMEQKQVTQPSQEEAWMSRWLKSPIFRKLPLDHNAKLLSRMREVPVRAGKIVIQQEDVADSYYVIKSGRCRVSRRPAPRAQEVRLTEIQAGQGFGEEALLTNAKRNASVTMLEDGVLIQLSKSDFIELLAKPLLRFIPFEGAIKLMDQGAVLVDVRSPEEHETDGIIGSLNMPLPVLRLKADRLDKGSVYIVYSTTGHYSCAAAFLLLEQGFNVYVLKGGLKAAPKHRLKPGATAAPAKMEARESQNSKIVSLRFNDNSRNEQRNKNAEDQTQSTMLPELDEFSALRHDYEDMLRRAQMPGMPITDEFQESAVAEFDNNPLSDFSLHSVSDEVLWNTTIGYRKDPAVESLLGKEVKKNNRHLAYTPSQGFEEINLFTPIASLQNSYMQESPQATQAQSNNRSFMNAAVQSKVQTHDSAGYIAQETIPKQGLSRRFIVGIIIAVFLCMIAGILIYTGSDSSRTDNAVVSGWLEKQRAMDEKMTRVLNYIDNLQGATHQQRDSIQDSSKVSAGSAAQTNVIVPKTAETGVFVLK